ncbi:dual specificity protein phosphatase family protein [Fictibacillus sp. KU28468]|uniref:dual specificity protein phosphatase family protein n=1 Tax=Fictibacillus sp. KU28468 TaxID=2991053 RepID=UPI00223D2FDC|nr:dual specificity protein phosphatase family protein [Fictibacillus sp. KU28468]UZJ79617.1 dual specificity protein phosphatase family protein [Fictibacillus sp. KU28468]
MVEMIPGKLYIGGLIRSEDWGFIQQNITAIINLRTTPDDPPFDFSGRVMIWAPLTVYYAPDIPWVVKMMNQMNQLLDSGYRILVHDTAGYQRLGFFITAFFMQRFNLEHDQALAMVRQRKPDLDPPPNYMELLKTYGVYLKQHLV